MLGTSARLVWFGLILRSEFSVCLVWFIWVLRRVLGLVCLVCERFGGLERLGSAKEGEGGQIDNLRREDRKSLNGSVTLVRT